MRQAQSSPVLENTLSVDTLLIATFVCCCTHTGLNFLTATVQLYLTHYLATNLALTLCVFHSPPSCLGSLRPFSFHLCPLCILVPSDCHLVTVVLFSSGCLQTLLISCTYTVTLTSHIFQLPFNNEVQLAKLGSTCHYYRSHSFDLPPSL